MGMKHVITISFLVAGLALASAQKDTRFMPDGFASIYLGMDWNTLVSLRPNAEIMNMMPDPDTNLKPDPEKPKGGLVERFPEERLYTKAFYVFEKGVLVAVMFGKEVKSDHGERQQFLNDVVSKCGSPASVNILADKKADGSLRWDKENIHINAILPSVQSTNAYGIVLQVMERKYAERIKALGASVKSAVHSDVTNRARSRENSLRDEVQRLLPVGTRKKKKKKGHSIYPCHIRTGIKE